MVGTPTHDGDNMVDLREIQENLNQTKVRKRKLSAHIGVLIIFLVDSTFVLLDPVCHRNPTSDRSIFVDLCHHRISTLSVTKL